MSDFTNGLAFGYFAPSYTRSFGLLALASRSYGFGYGLGYGFGFGGYGLFGGSHPIFSCYCDLNSPTGMGSINPFINYSLRAGNPVSATYGYFC